MLHSRFLTVITNPLLPLSLTHTLTTTLWSSDHTLQHTYNDNNNNNNHEDHHHNNIICYYISVHEFMYRRV